ncbi:hypothetical protein E1263_26065 [Kribbella antibiotica]|uniref:Uncharacterized protein n=1 Tax=Kribbella antibiotica TaxID=190195 RepID=A0A4R4ZDS2_9ACTN|nr:hypothetical protein [Kribbella antibiotica]TDD55419.1 hypothetical protein E1263_26065 [Kribbella antibiotica]
MIGVIEALELGNWRKASRILHDTELADPYLAIVLMTVARAMSYRAVGEHSLAWTTLGRAAVLMLRRHPGLPCLAVNDTGEIDDVPAWPGEVERLALPLRMARGDLLFRSVRLIWREQQELSDLFRRIEQRPAELTPATHILVLAFVEYLCWVRHDAGTWTRGTPVDDEAAAIEQRIDALSDGLRAEFLRSATDLRRLRYPAAGKMSLMVWSAGGTYNGLQRLAILELARRPEPPWGESVKPADCPSRLSSVNAWQFARTA